MKIALKYFLYLNIFLLFTSNIAAATYYVDSTNGSDSNNGISEITPWQTINKVNNSSFTAGDSILFKKGEVWRESLIIPSSGISGSPITFGAYGTGDAPIIYRSTNYTDWWEHSVLINGGFEYYTGTSDDGVADTISEYSLLPQSGDIIEIVSDSHTGSSAISVNKLTANNFGSWFRQDIAVSSSTEYYFEYYGKKEATAYLRMQIRDTANNLYLQDDGSWSSTNNYLEALDVTSTDWEMKSITFTTHSSTSTLDFRFHNYIGSGSTNTGLGRNYVDDIYLIQGSTHSSSRIWAGYIPNLINSWGLVDISTRVPYHTQYSGISNLALTDGYFYHQLNNTYFHYRKDSGRPTNTEVGTRKYGSYIHSKNYVTIDGINVIGVGGKNETGSTPFHSVMLEGTSDNVIIKNSTIKYGGQDCYGIRADQTTTNITYDNLDVSEHGSTGIYMNGSGIIKNSRSYNNGRVLTDVGDRSGIGSYQSTGIIIENNEVYNNAQDTQDADYEISAVALTGIATIRYNYVHTCHQGCVQISEGGHGSSIYYNVIDGFGSATDAASSSGKYSGIRIGGGNNPSGVSNVSIYNNIIANGSAPSGSNVHSGLSARFADTINLKVKNNIFYNNNTQDIYVYSSPVTTGYEIDYNNYYKSSYTNAWNWKNSNYSTLFDWQNASGQDSNSLTIDPKFIDFNNQNYRLLPTSPLINTGLDVNLSQDYYSNSVVQGSSTDIGIYEFLLPSLPTYLQQQTNSGQNISSSDWNKLSEIILKAVLNSTNSQDLLGADIEIVKNSQSFSNNATHTIDALTYIGSAISASKNIDISNGQYKWQIRATNPAGSSNWVQYGTNSSFNFDTSRPSNNTFELKSPDNKKYLNSTHPTFQFSTTTDNQGLDRYIIYLKPLGKSSFKYISDIPANPPMFSKVRNSSSRKIKYLSHKIDVLPKGNAKKLQDGTYEWWVEVVDKAGNKRETSKRKFTIDTEKPFVSLTDFINLNQANSQLPIGVLPQGNIVFDNLVYSSENYAKNISYTQNLVPDFSNYTIRGTGEIGAIVFVNSENNSCTSEVDKNALWECEIKDQTIKIINVSITDIAKNENQLPTIKINSNYNTVTPTPIPTITEKVLGVSNNTVKKPIKLVEVKHQSIGQKIVDFFKNLF